ncbi:NmrA family transcriptional regulator [Mumia zhuanghuii]|uniref:NmrA family transcriptional regulator n=1 Tax=Mumia zhuanghuii TaxID=2585211 RepID=A0A5C4MET0_9ACTN|nr:NmrA family transcriptional regulator [Mumia zhuanghuii]TNC41819.1 NmrA family transcriptional regulator [Mumia zhuanghuii]TNC50577.1 NmrA family transcriptional regulator [Mumia zhuanghuii]
MSRTHDGPVLVVGGVGKSARRVASRLDALGITVRAASRSTPVPFDWSDPSTWDAALDGVAAAYLSYAPDLAFPGAAEQVADLARRLAEHGIERVVLLSGRGEAGARAAEVALLDAVPTARVVRCSFFTQNFTEGVFADGVGAGELALPVPTDVPEPFVDLEDVADVAVAALRDDTYAGEVLELTGPESMTFGEASEALGAAVGRPVRFRAVTAEEFVADVVAAGEPAELAYGLVELFGEVLDGRNVATTDTVARVLGRPATPLAAAARRDGALLAR